MEKNRTDFIALYQCTSTYIRKFNKASSDISTLLNRALNSPDFPKSLDEEFKRMVSSEQKKTRGAANFYNLVYSLIESHVKKKELREVYEILIYGITGETFL